MARWALLNHLKVFESNYYIKRNDINISNLGSCANEGISFDMKLESKAISDSTKWQRGLRNALMLEKMKMYTIQLSLQRNYMSMTIINPCDYLPL